MHQVRHRKRPKKPLLSVDIANLPGPKPEVEEGNEGIDCHDDFLPDNDIKIFFIALQGIFLKQTKKEAQCQKQKNLSSNFHRSLYFFLQ